jgi:hypothetical protein
MIDFNDPQLDQHGQRVPLLTNTTFKDQIETGSCSGLKDGKYIHLLSFMFNINYLYDKTKSVKD